MYKFLHVIYQTFIEPKSVDADSRRREFLLNVLLTGLSVVALSGLLSVITQLVRGTVHYSESAFMMPVFVGIILFLLWLSRKGYSKYIAVFLVGFITLLATYSLTSWGLLLPMTQLLYALSIVLAGVLFRARAAIIVTILCSLIFGSISIAQVCGLLKTDTSWLAKPPDVVDALGGVFVFIVIGVVTWLANTEIDRALARARVSEASLAEERDNLEAKVKERTRELEEEQLIRVMELQRFAELGRLSASILHDIANPLTVASLNIGQLSGSYEPSLVRQVEQSLRYIERYVENARKQLLASGTIATFPPKQELKQVLSILSHQAKKHHVSLKISAPSHLKLTGDPIKFSQLSANLILNAIESYDGFDHDKTRTVDIKLEPVKNGVCISIRDYGRGLTETEKKYIFKPFYTTKSRESRNMGIGLSLVKQMVEKDFKGKLSVKSKPTQGTTFTVTLQHVRQ